MECYFLGQHVSFSSERIYIQLVLQNVREKCGLWCSAGARGLSRLLSSISLVWSWVGLYVFAGFSFCRSGAVWGFWDWSLDPPFVTYWWGVQVWSFDLSFVAPFILNEMTQLSCVVRGKKRERLYINSWWHIVFQRRFATSPSSLQQEIE